MTGLRVNRVLDQTGSPFEASGAIERDVLNEKMFRRMIAVERKRTERSKEPFLLMLLDAGTPANAETNGVSLENMSISLVGSSRETDTVGWYKERTTLGVLFTGLAASDKSTILSTILNRVKYMLPDEQLFKEFNQVSISFHFFPYNWDGDKSGRPSNPAL